MAPTTVLGSLAAEGNDGIKACLSWTKLRACFRALYVLRSSTKPLVSKG